MSNSKLQNIGKFIIEPTPDINSFFNENGKLLNTEISNKYHKKSLYSDHYNNQKLKTRNVLSGRLYKSVNYDPNRFNLYNAVKKIKKSIYDSTTDIFNSNSKIAYDQNSFNLVYQPRIQIMDYNNRKANRLTNKDGSVNAFLNEYKNIEINNYLIRNLQNESQKLIDLENENNRKINNLEMNYNNKNKEFEEYIKEQTLSLKTIGNALNDIYNKCMEFFTEKDKEEKIEKTIEDEMEKILINLEELRESCKFVTKVIPIDKDKFDNQVINRYYKNLNPNEKQDLGELTLKAIENYKFSLERDKNEEKELKKLLNDPHVMSMKFNEIENRILNLIHEIMDIQFINSLKKKENDSTINSMKEKLLFYESDIKTLKKLCVLEEEKINEIMKANVKKNEYAEDLLKEIYFHILSIQNLPTKINKYKKMNDVVKDCVSKIKNYEIEINDLIYNLEFFENEDPKLFINLINERKIYNKETKYLEQKRKIEEEREQLKLDSDQKIKRIIVCSRKTEAPFRSFKKIQPKNIIKEDNYEEYDIMFY